jgi:hypothetical protein
MSLQVETHPVASDDQKKEMIDDDINEVNETAIADDAERGSAINIKKLIRKVSSSFRDHKDGILGQRLYANARSTTDYCQDWVYYTCSPTWTEPLSPMYVSPANVAYLLGKYLWIQRRPRYRSNRL